MRLNVWMRLGIVLTVLWLLAAPVYFWHKERVGWWDAVSTGHTLCLRSAQRGPAESLTKQNDVCWRAYQSEMEMTPKVYGYALTGCAVIALVAWAIAFAATYTAKWVLAGRSRNSG